MKRLAVPLVLAAAIAGIALGQAVRTARASIPQEQATARVPRAALKSIEQAFDQTIVRLDINDPYDLLGSTRGVYLAGYGAVFTAELNLVVSPLTPFHRPPDEQGIVRLRQKKLERYEVLKQTMRQALITSAFALDTIPPEEHIAMGVLLFYRAYEDREGLPNQVLMYAPRQALMDYQARRMSDAALDAAIRIEEL